MDLRGSLPLFGAAVLATAGCHTIVEETPSPKAPNVFAITNPVAPLPQTGASPSPNPSPTPDPSPNPTPTPSPDPQPTPPNTNPVARLTVRVMFVVCDNVGLPNSDGATRVKVGCKAHLDLTAKDANNKPTDTIEDPEWDFSNRYLATIREDPWTPVLNVKEEGVMRVTAAADGITSRELVLTFYRDE